MTDAERQSPRTAVQNWLQVTDGKSTAKPAAAPPEQHNIERASRQHSRRHHTTRYPSGNNNQRDYEAGQTRRRHSEIGHRRKRVTDTSLPINFLKAQPQKGSKEHATVEASGLGLAERLRLHAPFRTFKDHSDDEILEVQCRPRKRRRSRSSTSSYLEPAAGIDLSDVGHDSPNGAKRLRPASIRPVSRGRGKSHSPAASKGSEMMLPSPEKLLKSYERRPRHKTRLDRYELKENKRHSKKTKQAAEKDLEGKKQKKHKRIEKSGAALMHNFAAQNVAHDRLTVSCA